jgi:hypothetical protein
MCFFSTRVLALLCVRLALGVFSSFESVDTFASQAACRKAI